MFLGISSFVVFEPWNVYACSQPNESSIYCVLNMLNRIGNDSVETLWINLREEPSMYSSCLFLFLDILMAIRLCCVMRTNRLQICLVMRR